MRTNRMYIVLFGAGMAAAHGCYAAGELCEAELRIACEGAGGCAGERRCDDSGKLGECECPAGEAGAASTTGTPPTIGDPGIATVTGSTSTTSGTSGVGFDDSPDSGSSTGAAGSTGSTSTGGAPEENCATMCAGKCGAVDCAGKYHECEPCGGDEVCQDNVCISMCTDRKIYFVNKGLKHGDCTSQGEQSMKMTMHVESPGLGIDLEVPFGATEYTLPYGVGGPGSVTCERRTTQDSCDDVWVMCSDDASLDCTWTKPVDFEISVDSCAPQVISGCE